MVEKSNTTEREREKNHNTYKNNHQLLFTATEGDDEDEIVMIMEVTMMLKLMCTLSCRISGTQGSQCLHFWQNFHICTMVFEHYSSSNFLGGFDKGIAGNLFLKCVTIRE